MSIVSIRVPQALKDRLAGAAAHFPEEKGLGSVMRRAIELGLDNLDAEGKSASDPVTALASIYSKMGCDQTPSAVQWDVFGKLMHEAFLHTHIKYVPRATVEAIAAVITRVYDVLTDDGRKLAYEGYLLGKLGSEHGVAVPTAVQAFMSKLPTHPATTMVEVFSRVLIKLLDDECTVHHAPAIRDIMRQAFPQLYPVAVLGLRLTQPTPQSDLDRILPGSAAHPTLNGFRKSTSRERNGVGVTVTIWDHKALGMITSLPAPTDLCMSFEDPFELLAVLENVEGDLPRLPTGVVEGNGYELCWMSAADDTVQFGRGYLRMQLPMSVLKVWRELLVDALRDPEFVSAYSRWRVFAGSL